MKTQQGRLVRIKKHGLFVIISTLLLSIIPITIVYMIYLSRKKIYTSTTEGIVKSKEIRPTGRRATSIRYIIEYNINGVTYTKHNIDLSNPANIGDLITLCYNSKDLTDILECKNLGLSTWFIFAYIWLLFIGAICIAWIV